MVNLDHGLKYKETDKSMSGQSRYNSVLTVKSNQGVAITVRLWRIPGLRFTLCICRGK